MKWEVKAKIRQINNQTVGVWMCKGKTSKTQPGNYRQKY